MKARAKRIDNNKYLMGYFYRLHGIEYIRKSKGFSREIDPSTLEYKIGDYWYSMETLERICSNLDIEYLPNKE